MGISVGEGWEGGGSGGRGEGAEEDGVRGKSCGEAFDEEGEEEVKEEGEGEEGEELDAVRNLVRPPMSPPQHLAERRPSPLELCQEPNNPVFEYLQRPSLIAAAFL